MKLFNLCEVVSMHVGHFLLVLLGVTHMKDQFLTMLIQFMFILKPIFLIPIITMERVACICPLLVWEECLHDMHLTPFIIGL